MLTWRMTFWRETTCWFSSLILSSLAAWLTWTFLLLFSSELCTSALFDEKVLDDFSYNTKPPPPKNAHCLCQWMPGNFCMNVNKNDQCYCFAQVQLQLFFLWFQQTSNLLIWSEAHWWPFKPKHVCNILIRALYVWWQRGVAVQRVLCTLCLFHKEQALILCHSQHFDARLHDFSHRCFFWSSEMDYPLWHCNTWHNS